MGVGGFITAPTATSRSPSTSSASTAASSSATKCRRALAAPAEDVGHRASRGRRAGHHDDGEGDRQRLSRSAATLATAPIADVVEGRQHLHVRRQPDQRDGGERDDRQIVDAEARRRTPSAMGKLLRDGLDALQKKFPRAIGDVRGMGLMQAIELVKDETAKDRTPAPETALRLFEETKKRGPAHRARRACTTTSSASPRRSTWQGGHRRGRCASSIRRSRRSASERDEDARSRPNRASSTPPPRQEAALHAGRGARRGQPLPLLRRRAVHQGVPDVASTSRRFIRKIATGNVAGSARTILDAEPARRLVRAGSARSRCSAPGAASTTSGSDEPIAIGRLQRFATERAGQPRSSRRSARRRRGEDASRSSAPGPRRSRARRALALDGHRAVDLREARHRRAA